MPGYIPADLVTYAVADHRHYACAPTMRAAGTAVEWRRRLITALVGAWAAAAAAVAAGGSAAPPGPAVVVSAVGLALVAAVLVRVGRRVAARLRGEKQVERLRREFPVMDVARVQELAELESRIEGSAVPATRRGVDRGV